METTAINSEFIDFCNCDLLVAGNLFIRVECGCATSKSRWQTHSKH